MAQDRLPAREPDVDSSRSQVPGGADTNPQPGDPHAGTGPSARGRHDIVEAEHTSFFWPEVDDLLTYEFSADLMDQLQAGLQAPPGSAPTAPEMAPPPAPVGPALFADLPGPLSPESVSPPPPGPNPFVPEVTVAAPPPPVPGGAPMPANVPPVPDLKLSSPVSSDTDTTIRTSPFAEQPFAEQPFAGQTLSAEQPFAEQTLPAEQPFAEQTVAAEAPPSGPGYVPDVVAGSFGAELAPPSPNGAWGPAAAPRSMFADQVPSSVPLFENGPMRPEGAAPAANTHLEPQAPPASERTGGLDGLRGSRLFDPRPDPSEPAAGRMKVGNLFEPTDPGGPPRTRRLVRLAGRSSPDEVDVTSARLVSPFDSSGPSVRSLLPSGDLRPDERSGRYGPDAGFGPGAPTSELRLGSPAPYGPDAGSGPFLPPVELSHSTVVDPAGGPPPGASFLAPAPADAWGSAAGAAWTTVADTVADGPRPSQGFLYLEDDGLPGPGSPMLRQAEPVYRDRGAMADSLLDVLDRKRGALLAGALALTVVLGGLLAFSKLRGNDDTTAADGFASSTTTASLVSPATGESGSGAGTSVAGPTTALSTETTAAVSSAPVTEAGSTSSTRKRATTSSSQPATSATTVAPTDPTTAPTQPPTSATQLPTTPTTQPPTTRPPTTRPPTTQPPTTRPPTTQPPTTQPSTTPTTQPPTSPPTTEPTTSSSTPSSGSAASAEIATP